MESAKRKRGEDGAVGDSREVTDAEVEEFYAILGRIRDASRRLSTAPSPSPSPGAVRSGAVGGGGARWSPAFAWEDFAVRDDATAPLKTTAAAAAAAAAEGAGESAEPRRIDLNADPDPEVGTPPR